MLVEEAGETGKFTVTQHRFLASGDVKPEEDETIWTLNLSVASQSHRDVRPNYSPLILIIQIVYTDVSERTATVAVEVNSADEYVLDSPWNNIDQCQMGEVQRGSERSIPRRLLTGHERASRRGNPKGRPTCLRSPRHPYGSLCWQCISLIPSESDAFALARSGQISLVQALQLAQNYIHEEDYTVWSDLSSNLADVTIYIIAFLTNALER